MAKRPKAVTTDATPLSSNPFAGLAAALPDAPDAEPPAAPASPAAAPTRQAAPTLKGRIIVRRQKKGQGGKAATFIEGLPDAQADDLLADLKRELGCSGRRDGAAVVVGTTDHQRVAAWLRTRGATKVILGN